jgi:hypothetical protein
MEMNNPERVNWRSLPRGTHGSEIAETAMILPLFFMMFMAVFWFGQAFHIYGTLTHATRMGAQAAIAPVCSTCSQVDAVTTNAQDAIYNALASAHLDKKNLVSWGGDPPKWNSPTLNVCGKTTPASCDGTVTDVCVQKNVQLSSPSQGGMGTCGISVSVRYQYPYHFSIPFTSLDLGNIYLPGQAQMRGETQ